jgi:hypothetical protein
MRYLMNTAGEELAIEYPWQTLHNQHQIVTAALDSGDYPLPVDFNYMINQTGWERSENVPLFGPLSPQDWTYLLGRDLVTYTIYASFRLKDGQFSIFPQPPPVGLDINFEYVSLAWVTDGDSGVRKQSVEKGNDIPVYNRTLISRYIKVKYYEAKGIDSTKAQDDFNQTFLFLTGQDWGAEILSAGRNRAGFPYLDTYRSTPDTNFGVP